MKGLFGNTFAGRKVLITGHTGFKGSWLSIWLKELGAEVIGYALEPYTENDNFVVSKVGEQFTSIIGDIRNYTDLKRAFDNHQPEIVFHLAAQSLVRLSYQQPKLTYDTNVGGTTNLLECCRLTDSVRVIVNVTSDKCYANQECERKYRETDPLGGYDPYSSSKGCAELVTSAYRNSFFNPDKYKIHQKSLSSVRAGNVIGGGDWQTDRIVPDCIKALLRNETIGIRSPKSVRPWQHVLDPLSGYLLLAARMFLHGEKYSGAWNFGPPGDTVVTVEELVKKLLKFWGGGHYRDLSKESSGEPYEAKLLMLDTSKAQELLNWQPTLGFAESIKYTVEWYKQSKVRYDFCVSQIREFIDKARTRRTISIDE